MTGQQDETRTVHLCVPLSIALPTENPAEQTPFRPWEMSPLFGARLCERECVRACSPNPTGSGVWFEEGIVVSHQGSASNRARTGAAAGSERVILLKNRRDPRGETVSAKMGLVLSSISVGCPLLDVSTSILGTGTIHDGRGHQGQSQASRSPPRLVVPEAPSQAQQNSLR
ncbi:hypothetical protein MRS44_001380 [Fusarium solani]|uniref:uncharacterized protein n=1 Tax=Fusarium solani TaxID=169388 RepID=UPI0032C3ED65|nr:hypothetical protein MRS44_001380 [Fusarium solani]